MTSELVKVTQADERAAEELYNLVYHHCVTKYDPKAGIRCCAAALKAACLSHLPEGAEVSARELLAAEYRKFNLPGPWVDLTVSNERDVAALRAIERALSSQPSVSGDEVERVAAAMPIIEVIAAWERKNGTVAAILPDEYEGFCKLIASAAVKGSARAAISALRSAPSISREDGEWVVDAARYTLDAADTPVPQRDSLGQGVQHAAWCLHEIIDGRVAGRKAHRWLGYAQGALVAAQWLSLGEAKLANKRASDEAALKSQPTDRDEGRGNEPL